MILDYCSLVKTLEAVNEKFLYGKVIPQGEALEAARWITSLQGKKGSYRGLPVPTANDFEQGIRLFTGERLVSASARHIMGQEAARAAWLLGNSDLEVAQNYHQVTTWIRELPEFQETGTFCCARCTLALWRHYWVGDFMHKEAFIQKGLRRMENFRVGDGKWSRYPFFYAVYTLVDLDIKQARIELRYARPAMERYIEKSAAGEFTQRRRAIIEKALVIAS